MRQQNSLAAFTLYRPLSRMRRLADRSPLWMLWVGSGDFGSVGESKGKRPHVGPFWFKGIRVDTGARERERELEWAYGPFFVSAVATRARRVQINVA